MEEADGRFGHGDASMVAHAFLEQHFCKIGHGKKSQNSVELLQQAMAMARSAEKMFSYCFLVRSKRKARPKETGNTRTKKICFLCFHI